MELELENIRPVSPDADSMNEITKILNDRAAGVSATQVSYLEGGGEGGDKGCKWTNLGRGRRDEG